MEGSQKIERRLWKKEADNCRHMLTAGRVDPTLLVVGDVQSKSRHKRPAIACPLSISMRKVYIPRYVINASIVA